MRLSAGMDEGPIYAQSKLPLTGHETKFELYEKLAPLGAKTLTQVLPSILDGSLQPVPQDNSAATYCSLLTKEDGVLYPNAHTAQEAERMVRAYLGFPKTKFKVNGHPIIITKARVVPTEQTMLDIPCKNSTILRIDELIAPSGRSMNADAFLRGYSK
jgi:methionyl-tRNA formyltransferase